jgi:hypothetical protein
MRAQSASGLAVAGSAAGENQPLLDLQVVDTECNENVALFERGETNFVGRVEGQVQTI